MTNADENKHAAHRAELDAPNTSPTAQSTRLTQTPEISLERPQDRAAKTRIAKTRIRIFAAFVRLARRPHQRQLTVAAICRQAGVSHSAFHKNFHGGVEELLMAVIAQIANGIRRDMQRQIARDPTAGRQIERTAIATARTTEFLARYPNLFQIEGIVPREAIVILSKPLEEAIIGSRVLNDTESQDVADMAKYHAAALIGITRSGLGKELPPSEYLERLTHAALLQITPPLKNFSDPQAGAELASIAGLHGALLLRLISLPSVARLARTITFGNAS